MADLECCGGKRKAFAHRLVSAHKDYSWQRFYHLKEPCPKCILTKMQWRGESPDGSLSDWFDIDPGAHAHWLRRSETEEARPEAQLMSEWAERMARPADVAIQYHTKLCQAHRWYKGQRTKV